MWVAVNFRVIIFMQPLLQPWPKTEHRWNPLNRGTHHEASGGMQEQSKSCMLRWHHVCEVMVVIGGDSIADAEDGEKPGSAQPWRSLLFLSASRSRRAHSRITIRCGSLPCERSSALCLLLQQSCCKVEGGRIPIMLEFLLNVSTQARLLTTFVQYSPTPHRYWHEYLNIQTRDLWSSSSTTATCLTFILLQRSVSKLVYALFRLHT
jgi:hypothetical protein